MYIRLRLYRVHDYDLYTLYYTKSFDFTSITRTALNNYARGVYNPYVIKEFVTKKNPRACVQITLILREGIDDDAINLVKKVKPGLRNLFIKNIIRLGITNINSFYMEDTENEYTKTESLNFGIKKDVTPKNTQIQGNIDKNIATTPKKSSQNILSQNNLRKTTGAKNIPVPRPVNIDESTQSIPKGYIEPSNDNDQEASKPNGGLLGLVDMITDGQRY